MLQTVVVAQHHAQFGLPVMVVNHHIEVVGEPADHFRIQRLAGAADDAQLALDRQRTRCRRQSAGDTRSASQ